MSKSLLSVNTHSADESCEVRKRPKQVSKEVHITQIDQLIKE
jgi:hypothetical protein